MSYYAEQKLKENHLLYEKYLENNYKLEPNEDPRITKFGRFLDQLAWMSFHSLLMY